MKKSPRFSRPALRIILMILVSVLLLVSCGNPHNTADNRGPSDPLAEAPTDAPAAADPALAPSPVVDPIDAGHEKIGPDHTHGPATNYRSDFQNKTWTVTFDAMDSTAYYALEIDPRDKLKVKSKLINGTAWIKITQGDLSTSALQKAQLFYDETTTLDLTQWQTGEIAVWLVVENGESGMIRVEQDFYAQSYLSWLTTTITKQTWNSPEEIDVSLLLDCTLEMTLTERLKAGNKGYQQDGFKLHVPAEVIEPLVYRYFDISENHLRSSSVYDAAKKEYVYNRNAPDGSLYFFEIDKISRQGGIATLEFHYYDYPSLQVLKNVKLTVDQRRPENKYLSCEVIEPAAANHETSTATRSQTFPQGFATNWSFTGKPQREQFHADRDIFGVAFSLAYDPASGRYEYLDPGMGDCDKIVSYTLTGTDFTVVLNGKYKLLYRDIPAWVNINKYVNDRGYEGLKDSYRMKSTAITTGKDGNYYLKIPFDWPYRKGEITYLSFDFGKLD